MAIAKTGQRPQPTIRHARRRSAGAAETFKETSESIIVAFILAFTFRTFVVEAFVIPTGSMAATLYGKHGALVCDDCGWENVYGLTDRTTRGARFGPKSRVQCQNCNHYNTNLAIHDGDGAGGRGTRVGKSNAESGDRILVFKWPVDFGFDFLKPQRWDVTVFKNPTLPDENFIKRLTGKPNEVLEIIDGDVYAVSVDDLSDETINALDQRRQLKFKSRSNSRAYRLPNAALKKPLPPLVLNKLADKLQICNKTPQAQQALWHVLYNHDYPPRQLNRNQPYWNPLPPEEGVGWSVENRRLTFPGGRAAVTFAGRQIIDHNAYNIVRHPTRSTPVSDMRLEAVLHPKSADGYIQFALYKKQFEFTLRLWADGRLTLSRLSTGASKPELIAETLTSPLLPDRPVEVAFQNVDYRVSVIIDGRELMATTPQQYAPDIKALRKERPVPTRPPVISAAGIELDLLHVVLYRDVYYTAPTFEHTPIASWAHRGWGTTNNPILLRDGEYFMLGDNSPASKDSRLWDSLGAHLIERGEAYQFGTVPEDQLVGRAFFVYWPSGLRPDWIPVLGKFGCIPNVGRMRWIR